MDKHATDIHLILFVISTILTGVLIFSTESGNFDSPDYQRINKIYSDNFYSRVEGANDGTPVDLQASHVIPGLSV